MSSKPKRALRTVTYLLVIGLGAAYWYLGSGMKASSLLVIIPICSFLIAFYFLSSYISLWITAKSSNIDIPIAKLVRMRLNKVALRPLVNNAIRLKRANLSVSVQDLESASLEGLDLYKITFGMIATRGSADPISFQRACDLHRVGKLDEILETHRVPQPEALESGAEV